MLGLSLQVIVVLALILFNGLLAMSELAGVSSRAIRLQQRAESGDDGRTRCEHAGQLDHVNQGRWLSIAPYQLLARSAYPATFG